MRTPHNRPAPLVGRPRTDKEPGLFRRAARTRPARVGAESPNRSPPVFWTHPIDERLDHDDRVFAVTTARPDLQGQNVGAPTLLEISDLFSPNRPDCPPPPLFLS
jgi:hypothetical protein